MTDLDANETPIADWLGPERAGNNLSRYVSTLRHRGWLIVLTMILGVIAAGVYVKVAKPVYKAQSTLLASPIPTGSSIPSNIPGLIYASSDPTRDVLTAATLVSSIEVARRVKVDLNLSGTPQSILGKVSVQPLSNTNVIAISAKSGSADAAARLANAFATTALSVRETRFRAAVNQEIAGLEAQGTTGSAPTAAGGTISVASEIAELKGLAAGPLPDMSLSAVALPPNGRSSPRATLSLAAGLVVGFIIGLLGVVALDEFDTRLRREDQLKRIFRLPILAHIPRDGGRRWFRFRRAHGPRTPRSLSFPALESFRVLRAMLLASRQPGEPNPRTLLVASAASGEGKTTTALNLAASLATSGADVILIEGDMRLPAIGRALNISSRHDVTSVVTGEATLEEALVSTDRCPGVRFLLGEGTRQEGRFSGDALFLPAATRMLSDAAQLADYVVVDSPPLLGVIDALEFARVADKVLIVAQLGRTDMRQLHALGTLLAEAHIEPAGISLIGADLPGGHTLYHYGRPGRREGKKPGLIVEADRNGVASQSDFERPLVVERRDERE
jgi:Mrp family chromosome partitioning ATPase/capsular polysaccharide biosynthesis protein